LPTPFLLHVEFPWQHSSASAESLPFTAKATPFFLMNLSAASGGVSINGFFDFIVASDGVLNPRLCHTIKSSEVLMRDGQSVPLIINIMKI